MKMSSQFPGAYLKADDLQQREVTCVIDTVQLEEVGSEQKPVVYFTGKKAGLVLNKTNCNTIAAVYGDESDEWHGRPVILYPTTTDFQGKRVECIRVRVPDDGLAGDDLPF